MKEKHALNFLKNHIKEEDKKSSVSFFENYKMNKGYFNRIDFNLIEIAHSLKKFNETKGFVPSFDLSTIKEIMVEKEIEYLKSRLKKRVLIKSLHACLNEYSITILLKELIEKNSVKFVFSHIKKNLRNQSSITDVIKFENVISKIFDLPNEKLKMLKHQIKIHNEKYNDNVEIINLKDSTYYIKSTEKSILLFKEICSKEYCVSYSVESYLKNINMMMSHYLFFDLDPIDSCWSSFMVVSSPIKKPGLVVYDSQNNEHNMSLDKVCIDLKGDCDSDIEESNDEIYLSEMLGLLLKDVDSEKDCYEKYFLKEDLNKHSKSEVLVTLIEKTLTWKSVEAAKKLISLSIDKKTGLLPDKQQRICLYLVQEITSEFKEDILLTLFNNDALDLLMEKLSEDIQKLIFNEIALCFDDIEPSSLIKEYGLFPSRKDNIIKNELQKSCFENKFKNGINDSPYEKAMLNILKYQLGILTKSDLLDIEKNEIDKAVLFEFLSKLNNFNFTSNSIDCLKDLVTVLGMMSIDLLEEFFDFRTIYFNTSERARVVDSFFEGLKSKIDNEKHPRINKLINVLEEEWRVSLLVEDNKLLNSNIPLDLEGDLDLGIEKESSSSNNKR